MSWNKLLIAIDQALGFQNKVTSNVVKKWQAFDNTTQEHVIQLEYRVKVKPADLPRPQPRVDLMSTIKYREQNLVKELIKYIDKRIVDKV
jgi:hypothetical protein